MKKTKYPVVLEDGGERVKIREVQDHGKRTYRIEYYVGGARKLVNRADEADARRDAKRALAMLTERAPVFVNSEDGAEFKAARKALGGVEKVDVAAREYAVALSRLGGASLLDAVEAFIKSTPGKTDKTIPVLVEAYVASLKGDVSEQYLVRVRNRLRRFAARFTGKLHEVCADEIEKWIKGFGLGKRARNNERAAVIAFSNWAKDRGYLPEGRDVEASKIKKVATTTTIAIFPVETVAKLLEALREERPELLPYAALGIFAGVRPFELMRLRFETALRWNFKDIEITAEEAKIGPRRLTKMFPNLAEWLADYRDKTGPLAPRNAHEKLSRFVDKKGIEWSPDVMRHSFISYAVAFTESVGAVALWAGNSEAVIKKHYLKRVTKDEGKAFFAILPNRPSNVVPMATAA